MNTPLKSQRNLEWPDTASFATYQLHVNSLHVDPSHFFAMLKQAIILCLSLLLVMCRRDDNYQGYVEGRYVYFSSNYAGVLKQLHVKRGAAVKAGQLLFVLEEQPERSQLEQAQARLNLAKVILKRREALIRQGGIQQESLDTARNDFQQAQAALAEATWTKQQKMVTTPRSGWIFDTYYLPGELVPAAHPVLALLAPEEVKIIFYIPEPVLSHLKMGQTISVTCDGCPSNISGKIDFISKQAEYTPPVIYSNERRDQLVYRIEAVPKTAYQLHPGQPVNIQGIR